MLLFNVWKQSPMQRDEVVDEVALRMGRDYFGGVQHGSFLGIVSAFLVARRLRRNLAQRVKWKKHRNSMFSRMSAKVWGAPLSIALAAYPISAVGLVCCVVTMFLKLGKLFFSSRHLYEFYLDEVDIQSMPLDLQRLYSGVDHIVEEKTSLKPTWADGVAVGLFGSVADAYCPRKSMMNYVHMRGGW